MIPMERVMVFDKVEYLASTVLELFGWLVPVLSLIPRVDWQPLPIF